MAHGLIKGNRVLLTRDVGLFYFILLYFLFAHLLSQQQTNQSPFGIDEFVFHLLLFLSRVGWEGFALFLEEALSAFIGGICYGCYIWTWTNWI